MGFHDDLVRFHGDLIVTIGMKGIIITIFSVELAFFYLLQWVGQNCMGWNLRWMVVIFVNLLYVFGWDDSDEGV